MNTDKSVEQESPMERLLKQLIPGIAGEVDINVFDGSASDWAAWLATHRHP